MAPAVMSDYPIAVLYEEKHLARPRLRRQRPAVAEDNRLSRTPIFVVDLGAILGCNRSHFGVSYFGFLHPQQRHVSVQQGSKFSACLSAGDQSFSFADGEHRVRTPTLFRQLT